MKKQILAIVSAVSSRLKNGEEAGRAYCSGVRDVVGDERIQEDGSFVSSSSRSLANTSESCWAARMSNGNHRRYLAALSALEGIARACGADALLRHGIRDGKTVEIREPYPLDETWLGDRHDARRWRVAAGRAFFAAHV